MAESDVENEAVAILRRLEPALLRLEQRVTGLDARLDTTLPTLATKADVVQLGYDLTWRFLSVMGVVLIAYLAAIWFVVGLVLKAHGVP